MTIASAGLVEALAAHGIIGPERLGALQSRAQVPWWLMALQTLAAWVASLLILSSFMLPLSLFGDSRVARALFGVMLCAGAIWLFRRGRLFTDQMALAFSLAGQALLVAAVDRHWGAMFEGGKDWAVVGLFAAAAMMLPRTSLLHRSLCGLLVLFDLGVLIGRGPALELYGIGLTALAAALWLRRGEWAASPHGALVAASARAAALAALALPAILGLTEESAWRLLFGATTGATYRSSLLSIGVALVFIAAGRWLLRSAPAHPRAVATGACLLLAVASQPAPGLIVAATLFAACFHASHRVLAAVALAAAVLYVGEYYYRLDTSLSLKAGLLAASGTVLLALRHYLVAARARA